MTSYYTLQPLLLGVFPSFRLAHFLHGAPADQLVAAPCLGWLAQGSGGEVVVVDTGLGDPTAPAAGLHSAFTREPEQRIDVAVRAAGIKPSDVTAVVFTHLHFDHCADGDLLPNARFFVQRQELHYAVAPEQRHRAAYDCGAAGVLPAWLRVFDRIEVLDGDTELLPGSDVVHIPGHTPGSCAVSFRTRKGRYAVAGDMVNRLENWHGDGGKPHVPPGFFTDLAECERSFLKLEGAADVVLASHDFRMLEQSVYPTIN